MKHVGFATTYLAIFPSSRMSCVLGTNYCRWDHYFVERSTSMGTLLPQFVTLQHPDALTQTRLRLCAQPNDPPNANTPLTTSKTQPIPIGYDSNTRKYPHLALGVSLGLDTYPPI